MVTVNQFIFYNAGHNGDIHYSRNFVKDILNKISINAEYHYEFSYKLVKDIKTINFIGNQAQLFPRNSEITYSQENKAFYINTWIGSSSTKFIENEVGCSLTANYEKFKHIFKLLNIEYSDPSSYIPDVNWSEYDIHFVDAFLETHKFKKYVLLCNGRVLSGQSANVDLNELISILADNNKDVAFILTDASKKIFKDNVFYTSEFITTSGGDLNEIGYLSTKSDIIIGRGSGPFCFTHNKDVLFNDKKTLIAFTNYMNDGLWALPHQLPEKQAKQLWSNNFDLSNMYNIIHSEIIKETK
jgi:hypothetical protein